MTSRRSLTCVDGTVHGDRMSDQLMCVQCQIPTVESLQRVPVHRGDPQVSRWGHRQRRGHRGSAGHRAAHVGEDQLTVEGEGGGARSESGGTSIVETLHVREQHLLRRHWQSGRTGYKSESLTY